MSKVSFFDQRITNYNWLKDETLNPQVKKERYLLVGETLRYTSSSNQNPAWHLRPQQELAIMRFSDSDLRLKSASANMIATKGS